ncbi:MAG: D-glycero-beta-D-manno-heptose 1-phosphate adenylyltransferase [Candidatus Omnitrophota bacterium]
MLKNKIISLVELSRIRNELKKRKLVFTNGCFDLLHFGHVKYLEEAKAKGDVLVVAVNSDSSIRKIKGKGRPITQEKDRLGVIAGLESVDYVVKFNQSTPLKVIQKLKPDILVKGADWNQESIVGADFVRSYRGRVCRIKLLNGRSTTNLIKKIGKIRD